MTFVLMAYSYPRCGGNGMMECDPKDCPASPMMNKLLFPDESPSSATEGSSSRKGGRPSRLRGSLNRKGRSSAISDLDVLT